MDTFCRVVRYMIIGAWPLAVATGILVSGSPTAAGVQPPLTPGTVALLVNNVDADALRTLRAALTHDDAVVRAVAARVVSIAQRADLLPELAAALARESAEAAAAEQVRALLYFDDASARETAEGELRRAGLLGARVYGEWLVRTRNENLAARLESALRPFAPISRGDIGSLIAFGMQQQPAERSRLLRVWLHAATPSAWRNLLERLSLEERDAVALGEALESDKPESREQTIWALLAQLGSNLAVPSAILDAALAGPESQPGAEAVATPSWETFGRELLLRRHRQSRTADRSEFLAAEAARHIRDASLLLNLKELTDRERTAARKALADARAATVPVPTAPGGFATGDKQLTMRLVPIPWPGFLTSLLDVTGCKARQPAFGVAAVTYRPDGRPASGKIDATMLPPSCEPVLNTFARITVTDVDYPVGPGPTPLMIVPVHDEFAQCVDQERSRTPAQVDRPLVRPGIEAPRKIRDVRPAYPTNAQRAGVQGTVILEATISAAGCVTSGAVLRSVHPALDFAALRAVTDWRFTPTLLGGEPVPVIMTVTVNFRLQ